MNLIQELEKEQIAKLSAGKQIPDFGPGDTLIVNVKVVEGERSRVQGYEGVCIGRSGAGLNENFTVRKISYGEGVERVFPLYSPMIEFDQGHTPRQSAAREALLFARPARQGRTHYRAAGAPSGRAGARGAYQTRRRIITPRPSRNRRAGRSRAPRSRRNNPAPRA